MGLKIYQGDDSTDNPSFNPEHLLGQYIPLHYHHHMLQDQDRTLSFRKAIEAVVSPGMKVV
ncbi:MAG: hypothetical protein RLY14_2544, partial [Planctomycetota bacterium]